MVNENTMGRHVKTKIPRTVKLDQNAMDRQLNKNTKNRQLDKNTMNRQLRQKCHEQTS